MKIITFHSHVSAPSKNSSFCVKNCEICVCVEILIIGWGIAVVGLGAVLLKAVEAQAYRYPGCNTQTNTDSHASEIGRFGLESIVNIDSLFKETNLN